MTLAVQFQHLLAEPISILPAYHPLMRKPRGPTFIEARADRDTAGNTLRWASVQLPECEYLDLIVNAIECADKSDEFRVIRAAINKVSGMVNRGNLRMMVQLREREVAHE